MCICKKVGIGKEEGVWWQEGRQRPCVYRKVRRAGKGKGEVGKGGVCGGRQEVAGRVVVGQEGVCRWGSGEVVVRVGWGKVCKGGGSVGWGWGRVCV